MASFATHRRLVEIDSPTGFTTEACADISDLLASYGWTPRSSNEGAVQCALGPRPALAVAAHSGTLGAMVSAIRDDGTLRVSALGGLSLNLAEGEHVTVYPYYDSDGSAALRAGNESRAGLIGPGIAASHVVERTHARGIEATIELALACIEDQQLG
jgi:putative aminopeptidase FrvX